MQSIPEGGELDPAEDLHKYCKKNSPSELSCIDETKERCDRGNEVETVHSGLGGKGPVPLRRPREYVAKEIFVRESWSQGGVGGCA